ncbi:endolytic transglycosylase MltG [Nitratifractor sp.]
MKGRSSRTLRIIHFFESLILLILLPLLFYLTRPVSTPKNLFVPEGNIDSIIAQLQHEGMALGTIDAAMLRRLGTPRSGWIYLGHERMNRLDLLRQLAASNNRYKKITLIPGETTVLFFDELAKSLDLNRSKLQQAYETLSPYPEAGILAESYNIPLHYDEKRVISYLDNLTRRRYKALAEEAGLKEGSREWLRILIIASIIQKEAANRGEMPLVASVIYNRLKKKMRLQMDGTLNYGRYSHVKVTPQRIRDDNSTYNTYKHRGLPAAPVCNVSETAIRAAIHPTKSDYLYFFRNDRGTHDFFEDYKSHLKEVKRKRKELKEKKQ